MWYQRMFGDTRHFALQVEFDADPHPANPPPRDHHPGGTPSSIYAASWGRLAIWVHDRCLTRSVRGSGVADAVEWHLLPFLGWMAEHGVASLNEEPYPLPTRRDRVAGGVDWFLASEEPIWTTTIAEADAWYDQRSAWRERHALRCGFPDAAFPTVFLRRLGDFIEFSWDNESYGSRRSDLRFVEQRGVACVGASRVESVWSEFVREAGATLADRVGDVEAPPLRCSGHDTWRRLVPPNAASFIERRPELLKQLRRVATDAHLVVPHTLETLLLRSVGGSTDSEIRRLLRLQTSPGAASTQLEQLRRPRPAPRVEPWMDGYDAAMEVRDALGWGTDPAPRLDAWCEAQRVEIDRLRWKGQVDAAVLAPATHRPLLVVNADSNRTRHWSARTMQAASLGVLLLDAAPDRDFAFTFGAHEDWPSAARARAFAAMLLMPEDGVRACMDDQDAANVEGGVRMIMRRYDTTLPVTTWHLMNLGFIDEEERLDLVRSMSAA